MQIDVFLIAAVVNRIVELVKEGYPPPGENPTFDRWARLITLVASMFLGGLITVAAFPDANLFVGTAATPIAGQIFTGIVIGGLANGYDWITDLAARALSRGTVASRRFRAAAWT